MMDNVEECVGDPDKFALSVIRGERNSLHTHTHRHTAQTSTHIHCPHADIHEHTHMCTRMYLKTVLGVKDWESNNAGTLERREGSTEGERKRERERERERLLR